MADNIRIYHPDKMSEALGLGIVIRPFCVPSWNVFYVSSKSIFGLSQEVNVEGHILSCNGKTHRASFYGYWDSSEDCRNLKELFHFFKLGNFYHVLCHTFSHNMISRYLYDEIMLVHIIDNYKIDEPIVHAETVCFLHTQEHKIEYCFELNYIRRRKFNHVFNFGNVIDLDD